MTFRKPRPGRDRDADRRDEDVVESHPKARGGDKLTLSEEEAFEDQHPYATQETFEAQTTPRRPLDKARVPGGTSEEDRDERREEEHPGSALPEEEGHRS